MNDVAVLFINNVNFEARDWKHHIHFDEVYGNCSAQLWSRKGAISRLKDEVLAALVESKKSTVTTRLYSSVH